MSLESSPISKIKPIKRVDYVLVATNMLGQFLITKRFCNNINMKEGDKIVVLNNIKNINDAIDKKLPIVVNYCKKHNLDIESDKTKKLIHEEFDMWGVAKGFMFLDKTGNPVLDIRRKSWNTLLTYLKNNKEYVKSEVLKIADDDTKQKLLNASEQDEIAILMSYIKNTKKTKYSGATLLPSKDDNYYYFYARDLWKDMKYDCKSKLSLKTNRIFPIYFTTNNKIKLYNGYKMITVTCYPLGNYKDEK